jgi:hypothetical protein
MLTYLLSPCSRTGWREIDMPESIEAAANESKTTDVVDVEVDVCECVFVGCRFRRGSFDSRAEGQSLRRSGHLVLTHALQSTRTAVTVRVRGGDLSVTDGPYAETKEMVGGFFLIETRDRDEAIRLASGWPSARLGSIEVRAVEDTLPADRRYR